MGTPTEVLCLLITKMAPFVKMVIFEVQNSIQYDI